MNVATLRPYMYGGIEDWGGVTSPSYKTFEKKYRNYLKKVCKNHGWELVKFSPNHYCFSCFIKKDDKYVYMSVSDVRYFSKEWYNNILVRTAKSDHDYTGGSNNYTDLDGLEKNVKRLFERNLY